ncbi:MAG: hypothetical protein B6D40_02025 [Anaerolineae bacterium UTCFX3]|nr:MAG: hypothetical protein B6D40_02025 [Anaerolineae bacterium UTCFX3]
MPRGKLSPSFSYETHARPRAFCKPVAKWKRRFIKHNSRMKVLSIDDDIAMTELTAMLLRTHGFDVLASNNAREAILMVREKRPHAVILDLMMPDMDGRQVCRAIREFSNVPIIILSALNDPETVASALDSGADDYLVKPVPSDVLAAHLNRLIKRTGQLNISPDKFTNKWIPSIPPSPTQPAPNMTK